MPRITGTVSILCTTINWSA